MAQIAKRLLLFRAGVFSCRLSQKPSSLRKVARRKPWRKEQHTNKSVSKSPWFVRLSACTSFSALPLGELAFVKQMTERAAHWQIRIRANLKSHVSWFQPSLSLRDISPGGRDKLICAYNFSQTKISRRKILREIVFYTSLFYLKYLTPFSKIGWYFSPKMFWPTYLV